MIGSATIPAERTIVSFHQGLGWVAQVVMFLTLGLLVFPAQLSSVAVKGTVLAIVLVFLARPIAVEVAALPFAYEWRERLILGWAGLRGAVPVVLATFPVIEHVPRSLQFFNIVFFAVLVSTVVQGSTFEIRAPLATDHHRAGAAAPARRSPGRSGAWARRCSIPDRIQGRDRRRARARPWPAARRRGQRHRSR